MHRNWKDTAEIWLTRLVRAEQFLAVCLLLVVLGVMGAQVFARYVFQTPLSWSEEVARFAMIWLTFIAASFVLARNQHIAVDLRNTTDQDESANQISEATRDVPWRWSLTALISLIILVTCLMLLIGGLPFVLRVYPVGSPSTGISKSYWYGAASVGLALMSLHAFANLLGLRIKPASSASQLG